MAFGMKNHVKVDPLKYDIFLLGESKIGKTTMIYEVCNKLAGDDGYLFLELGQEHGANAIEGINYVNCPKWNMPYDELTNSAGFADVVDDIVYNKTKDYKNLKTVVFDTYDQLVTLAEKKAVDLYNREAKSEDKKATSINSAWGGFGRGVDKAIELILEKMSDLESVGVKTIVIGHTKTKDIEDIFTGEKYSQLTSNLSQKYFNALKQNMDVIALAFYDRQMTRGEDGKNRIVSETRKIRFRDDNYNIDAGGRFADIRSEIELDPDEFISAINDAIKAEQQKSNISFEETAKNDAKTDKAIAKRVEEEEKKRKEKEELSSILETISDKCRELSSGDKKDGEWISELKNRLNDLNIKKVNDIENIKDAKSILEFLNKYE